MSLPRLARPAARTFSSSAARRLAVAAETPTLIKDFKIYRWVRLEIRAFGGFEV
jgi:hypothetical protein